MSSDTRIFKAEDVTGGFPPDPKITSDSVLIGPNNVKIRTFDSGATRDTNKDKLDYAGFLSPIVLKRFAEYMHSHREQSDGELRPSDNWKKGIPIEEYFKSLARHFIDVYLIHDGFGDQATTQDIEECLCAVMFNSMGYLHEILKEKDNNK